MIRAGGALLIVNAAWNLAVWPPFLRRVARDPRARDERGNATAFLHVHVVITSVAAALGVASLVSGARLVARSR